MKYIFKSIFRNFSRRPVTNLINLLGLTVSLALVIILFVYCYSEFTTDNFHKNGDRIYLYGQLNEHLYTPAILKDQVDLNIPDVETSVRIAGSWGNPVFQVDNNVPIESEILFADEDFFKLFTYKAIVGNLETSLKTPMTVAISKTLSKKLFGDKQALGKIIKINNDKELIINAVFDEPEANSCLAISAVTSIDTRKKIQHDDNEFNNWGCGNFQTFILLKKGTSPTETLKKILNIIPTDRKSEYADAKLTPFKQLYFSKFALFGDNYLHCGDKTKVWVLLIVAFLVLLIAIINFINISSTQWLEKIRQTGVMKVIGARRSLILRNFLGEACLFFLIALIIAICLINIISTIILNYTGIHFNPQLIYSPSFFLLSIIGILMLSLILSFLPAYRITSSKALDNLKKAVNSSSTSSVFRSVLVTLQYTIAIVLIAFTVLVQKQIHFGSNKLGFNKDNTIGIKLTQQLWEKREVVKKILQEKPAVSTISFAQFYPGKQISTWGMRFEIMGEKKILDFNTFSADASFFNIMGLKLIMGRLYSGNSKADERKIVVNETFLRKNNITNPMAVKFYGGDGEVFDIVGVIKDFHYRAINEPIAPLAIRNQAYASHCLVKLKTNDFNLLHSTFQQIKTELSKLSPSFPVEISFFDQAIEKMYQSELQFRRSFSLFATCAIIICSLGILAMSLLTCQKRTKEIGIRKVNGAQITEILAMLNTNFIKWIAVAFILACPIAWYTMNKWLENFAYKTEVSWWVFAAAGAIALVIALLTVSLQSYRAATMNPVEALKYE